MNILIIEDEKAAIRNLKAILSEEAPQHNICGEADSIIESINWLKNNPMPDLIFLDIHLADGSAFEIFNHVKINCPIIFTTAYDEYAIKAFKVNSIDYLLKPIDNQDMRNALNKLKNLKGEESNLHLKKGYRNYFLIHAKGDKLIPIPCDAISYFYIEDSIVKCILKVGEKHVFNETLDEIADSLDPNKFFRANRQYIISRDSIKDMDLWFNGRLAINLFQQTPEKIFVSKAKANEFKDWFVK